MQDFRYVHILGGDLEDFFLAKDKKNLKRVEYKYGIDMKKIFIKELKYKIIDNNDEEIDKLQKFSGWKKCEFDKFFKCEEENNENIKIYFSIYKMDNNINYYKLIEFEEKFFGKECKHKERYYRNIEVK